MSVVRFRPRPPGVLKKPVHSDGLFCLRHADLHCNYDQHTLRTVKFRDLSWVNWNRLKFAIQFQHGFAATPRNSRIHQRLQLRNWQQRIQRYFTCVTAKSFCTVAQIAQLGKPATSCKMAVGVAQALARCQLNMPFKLLARCMTKHGSDSLWA